MIGGDREPGLPARRECGLARPDPLGIQRDSGPGTRPPGRMGRREGARGAECCGAKSPQRRLPAGRERQSQGPLFGVACGCSRLGWQPQRRGGAYSSTGGNGEGCDHDRPYAVSAGLGREVIEHRREREGGGGKANSVSRWQRPHAGREERAQSGTVNASSASVSGSAYWAKKRGSTWLDSDAKRPAAGRGERVYGRHRC